MMGIALPSWLPGRDVPNSNANTSARSCKLGQIAGIALCELRLFGLALCAAPKAQ